MATMAVGSRSQYMTNTTPPLGFPPTEKKYAFPIEPDHSILEELDKIGISEIREHDLQHPNQQIAFTCFTAFLEDLSYVDDAVIRSLKDYDMQREDVDHMEIYDEGVHFVVRFNEIRALMIAARISDFCVPDLCRPKPKRFKKQICALLNFHHFHKREKSYWDDFHHQWKTEVEETFDRIDSLQGEMPQLRAKVERMQKEQESWKEPSHVKEVQRLSDNNTVLLEKAESMNELQQKLMREYEESKAKEEEDKGRRERLKLTNEALADEKERLRMRIELSPTQLRDMNEKQRRWIEDKEEARLENERKSRSLSQKKRVLEKLEVDIEDCKRLANEGIDDMLRMNREIEELGTIDRDGAIQERGNLHKQLENARIILKNNTERLDRAQKMIQSERTKKKEKGDVASQEKENAERQKRRRIEQANQVNQEVDSLEEEYDRITRDFDEFYSKLVADKEKLEKMSRQYMQAMAERMDLQVDVM